MSQITPIVPPIENNNISPWLINGLLPRNQVVLLDGCAAVGKTALLALLSQRIIDDNKKRTILYLSSKRQTPGRDLFLHRQRVNFGQLQALHFDHENKLLQSRSIYVDLIQCIGQAIQEKQPHCLMIDGLDELLDSAPDADAKLSRQFWAALHRFAEGFQCTIIVTRNQGFHETRAYGHFTRAGSDLCHFALAMHWHPQSTSQRIVTICRHHTGPIGRQFHMKFTNDRGAELTDMQTSQHLRPAKTPPHDLPIKPARQQTKPAEPSNPTPVPTISNINPPHPELIIPSNYENRAHERTNAPIKSVAA